MRLIMGGINGDYLRNITEQCVETTEEVLAAVAYALDDTLLFEWCWHRNIPLKFYGRLDDTVPVSVAILRDFLAKSSPNFVCRLVQYHHAKVIWWRGSGVYIGSANLTHSAWYKNIEAGCFFPEAEIDDRMAADLEKMFATLEKHATPLTEELCREMARRDSALVHSTPNADAFWASPSFNTWSGLGHIARSTATERRRQDFLREWHDTLQYLRDIGSRVSRPENRPAWVSETTPKGAQADQFLHAHYYQRTFDGRRANYATFYEANKGRIGKALSEAVGWWKSLPNAPQSEAEMLNITAPRLRSVLSRESVDEMNFETFREICSSVHAIKDYARRVSNAIVNLPSTGVKYTIAQKVTALAKRIWDDGSSNGQRTRDLIRFVLYGGIVDETPERLWQSVSDPRWKIQGLGISALGELVGWAAPDQFPPRNGRTSKALRSLGYDVTIHVE